MKSLLVVALLSLGIHGQQARDCTFTELATCALTKFPATVIDCLSADATTRANCDLTTFCSVADWQTVSACFDQVPCYGLEYQGRPCSVLFDDCTNDAALDTALCPAPTPAPTFAPIDPQQILIDFYNAAGGPNWFNNNGWLNTTMNYCDWYGVTCTGGVNVIGLNMHENNLVGTISESLGTLHTLTTLDLSENLMSGPVDPVFTLINLEKLYLGERFLTSVCVFPYQGPGMEDCQGYPDGGQMEALYVPLYVNTFTGDASPIQNLTKLTHLTIRSPFLEFHMDESLCNAPALTYFFVRFSPLAQGYIPDCAGTTLNSLDVMIMDGCSFSGTLPGSMKDFQSLRQLSLQTNQFEGSMPNFSPKLMHYFLSQNKLNGTIPPAQPYVSPDGVQIPNLMEGFVCHTNNISGTIPYAHGTMLNLKYYWITLNSIEGTIPSSFSEVPLLASEWGRNKLTGPFPSGIFENMRKNYTFANVPDPYCQTCAFGSLIPVSSFPVEFSPRVLRVSQNQLTGTLPSAIADLPELYDFELDFNQIEGDIQPLLAGAWPIQNFKVANNKLSGRVDVDAFCGLKNATVVSFGHNQLTGSLPYCLDELPNLVRFTINNNLLSGSIPSSLGQSQTVRVINMAHNNIEGVIPVSVANMSALQAWDISHNKIAQGVYNALINFAKLPALTSINFESNQLVRNIDLFLLAGIGVDTKWEACKSWNLANNKISGEIPFVFDTYALQMSYLNLEGNELTGTVPFVANMDVVLLKNNPGLKDAGLNPDSNLPTTFQSTDFFLKQDDTFSCPQLTGVDKEMVVSLDPSYYNYSLCRCEVGYWGYPPNCSKCLDGGVCDGSNNLMKIPPGLFPTPDAQNPTHLITCGDSLIRSDTSNCNPENSDVFKCKEGTTGRLCGKCLEGYYQKQTRCHKCPSVGASIAIVIVFFVVLMAGVALLRLIPRGRKEIVLVVKTLIVYMQFGSVIVTKTGLRWPPALVSVNFVFDLTAVNLAFFSCVAGDALIDISVEQQALSFIVLILFCVAAFFFLLVFFELLNWIQANADETTQMEDEEWDDVGSEDLDEENAQEYFNRDKSIFETKDEKVKKMKPKFFLVRGTITVLKFLYLPITTGILQMFQCEEDPGLGKRYMKFNTARECSSDDEVYQRNFILACILIPIYVIGFPVFVVVLSVRYELKEKVARNVWFFLFNDYQQGKALFLLWSLMRQLLLSVICVLIPQSAGVTLTLLVLHLGVILLVNTYVAPYKESVQNYQEDVAFVVLAITLALGLVNSGLRSAQEELVAAIILLVQILFVLALIYSILLAAEVIPAGLVPYLPFWRFITNPYLSYTSGSVTPRTTSPEGTPREGSLKLDSPATSSLSAAQLSQLSFRGAALKDLNRWLGDGGRILVKAKKSPYAQRSNALLQLTNESMLKLDELQTCLKAEIRAQKIRGNGSDSGSFTSSPPESPKSADPASKYEGPGSIPMENSMDVEGSPIEGGFFVPVDKGARSNGSDEAPGADEGGNMNRTEVADASPPDSRKVTEIAEV